jgi:protein-arginine kinase activator protein McsA
MGYRHTVRRDAPGHTVKFLITTYGENMSRISEIKAQIEKLNQELKLAIGQERAAAIADVRKKIQEFKITTTELKGLFRTRTKKTDQQ